VTPQFLSPEFLYHTLAKLYSNHWVVWIGLPAATLIFKVLNRSDAALVPRVKGFVFAASNTHALANFKGSSANIIVDWTSPHVLLEKFPTFVFAPTPEFYRTCERLKSEWFVRNSNSWFWIKSSYIL
jgi:hypothetical protein